MNCLDFAMLSEIVIHPSKHASKRIANSAAYYSDNRAAIVDLLMNRSDLFLFVNSGSHREFHPLAILCTHHNFRDENKSAEYLETIVRAGFPLMRGHPERSLFLGAINSGRLLVAEKMLQLEDQGFSCGHCFMQEVNSRGQTPFHVAVGMLPYKHTERYFEGFFDSINNILQKLYEMMFRVGPEILNFKSRNGRTALTQACQNVLIQPRGLSDQEKTISNSYFSHYHLSLAIMFLDNYAIDCTVKDDEGMTPFDYLIPGVTGEQFFTMTDAEIEALEIPLEVYIPNEGSGSMRLRNYLLAHESIWLTTVLPDYGEQEARGGSWLTVKVIFDNIKFSMNQKNIREVMPVFK